MRRKSQKERQKELRRCIETEIWWLFNYTEANVILFKNKEEEEERLQNDFDGIFVRVHPDNPSYAEILEVISKEGIQRPIAIADVVKYDTWYAFKEDAIEEYKNIIIVAVAKNYKKALVDRMISHNEINVNIAISVDLAEILFGSLK